MNQFFYPRLALTNMKKHRKTYIPYLLASIITISMFYTLTALSDNTVLFKKYGDSGESMMHILKLSVYIIAIFSCIFIFYSNSFLTKKRKKEIGLYNILGMEKRHIMCMLLFETIYTITIIIICGLLLGIIFGKILFLLLFKITLSMQQDLPFPISAPAIRQTILIFIPLFLATLLSNIWNIHFANPITLLQGSNVGEKEPKTKWSLVIISIISLGSAYYIAQTFNKPADALTNSFYTIVLIIIGTYALFISVSIAILKFLKKRERFYYQTNHFTIVSGMIYRMKQNAVGLANICVLSTCVIIMSASTFSLYFGVNDRISREFPYKDFINTSMRNNEHDISESKQTIRQYLSKHHIPIQDETQYHTYRIRANVTHNAIITSPSINEHKGIKKINILLLEEYNRIHGSHVTLQPHEILWLNHPTALGKKADLTINKELFSIKDKVFSDKYAIEKDDYNIVVADEAIMKHIFTLYETGTSDQPPEYIYAFNTSESMPDMHNIVKNLNHRLITHNASFVEQRDFRKGEYLLLYGGFVFIGIFLAIEFLLATALIIYYKQISEGYDDKEKYEIMQKVGMSTKEIKKSIQFQVLSVFFLPIVVAIMHFSSIFKIITTLLYELGINDVSLFLTCSAATIAIFLVFYSIVYFATSKVYYKIIK